MSPFKIRIPEGLRQATLCLTGATGYVGGHLAAALVAQGLSPVLIGRPSRAPEVPPGARGLPVWRDAGQLAEALGALDEVVLLNIAGHFVSQHAPGDIPALIDGNLTFPVTLFDAMARAGHHRIVNIGTAWEVSDRGAQTPANLYAMLKASNAQALAYFARTAPLCGVQLKLLDTYGGVDPRAKLLALLKSAAREEREMVLRNPAQTINLCHVTDVCEAILAAAVRTGTLPAHQTETAFVLSPETVTIGALVDQLSDVAPGLRTRFSEPPSPPARDVWDTAPRLTGWQPRIGLHAGLAGYFGDTDET